MIFYKVNFSSSPIVRDCGMFTYKNFYNHFPGYKNVIELSIIERGDLRKISEENEALLSEGSFVSFLPDFKGYVQSVFDNNIHRHFTIGMFVNFTYEIYNTDEISGLYKILLSSFNDNKQAFAIIPQNCNLGEYHLAVYNLLYEISYNHINETPSQELLCISNWYKLLSILTEVSFELITQKCNNLAPSAVLYIQKAISFINLNLNKQLKVTDVSTYLGITPNYLANIFKTGLGYSVIQYINKTKIDKIKQLLSDTKTSLMSAGATVGIYNVSYLSKLFKQHTGMTAHEYKQAICGLYSEYNADTIF